MTDSKTTPAEFLKEEARRMQRRLVAHIPERSADLCAAPMEVASTIYTDPARFEAERKLFRSVVQIACLSNEIQHPGDCVVFDAAGPSIIVTRNNRGEAQAFLNMCPHRGSRLLSDSGNNESIFCPFHGWRFNLDGQLLRRSRADAFESEQEPERSLIPVPVAEWHGLIFIRATPSSGAIDVDAFLGDMAPIVRGLELEHVFPVKTPIKVTVNTNWKLNLDTFCEGYHVPTVHKPSFGGSVVPYVTIQDLYGIHGRYIGPATELKELVDVPESEWPEPTYSATQILFPNASLTLTDAIDKNTPMLTLFRLFPGEHIGQSLCLMTSYVHSTASHVSQSELEALTDMLMQAVIDEDYGNACNTWQGLQHGASDEIRFVFGRNEAVLQNYHRALASELGMPID